MTCAYGHQVHCFPDDRHKALYLTLIWIVHMSKMFLTEKNLKYLLSGHFQSNRIEGEFGVFHQVSGGTYYISYEQVLTMRRL